MTRRTARRRESLLQTAYEAGMAAKSRLEQILADEAAEVAAL
jgi:hypothetical protein